jgi:hypothetical protein
MISAEGRGSRTRPPPVVLFVRRSRRNRSRGGREPAATDLAATVERTTRRSEAAIVTMLDHRGARSRAFSLTP